MRALSARRWVWAAQITVAVVVAIIVWQSLARNWAAFRALHLSLAVRPLWVAGSALLVLATYAVQIESWRRILAGWGQRISFGAAARAWSLANLGRYIPGKVWSVTGMMVLAQRAGVQAAPAAASAVVNQALIVGAGAAVVAAGAPGAASPLRLGVAALVAVVGVAALVWSPTARWLGRLVNVTAPLEPLRPSAVGVGAALVSISWVMYGVAFWLLARGLIADAALPLTVAAGVFAAGSILGWLALFAPGGVGVRELVFIGLLTPYLGSGGAVALSVASRILLTVTEVSAALATGVLRHLPGEATVASS
jgi:uncharacterized membrane protein YbhN (UPF0104 family)